MVVNSTLSSSTPYDDDRKGAILVGFLSAGLDPAPSRAVLVSALADARRTIAALRSRREPIDQWLASEIRFRGVRENAAVLAALEVSGEPDAIANAYRERYPQRSEQLDNIVAFLKLTRNTDVWRT
jgi:hypothetical protein